jgi:hypothetical protein
MELNLRRGRDNGVEDKKLTGLEDGAAGREPCRFGLKQFAWRQ